MGNLERWSDQYLGAIIARQDTHLEFSVGPGSLGVNNPLRNPFSVEM
jgi:hypothetical protein